MDVLSVVSLGGGMGRTTTVVQLALALSSTGRVLVVDLDPQATCTRWLGGALGLEEPSGLEVLNGSVSVHTALRAVRSNLWILPADWGLGLQSNQLPLYDQELLLRHKLSLVAGDFDYVVVDSMVGKSVLTVMACCAAQKLIIPVEVSPKGVIALEETLVFLEELKKHNLPIGEILGILPMRDQWIGNRRAKLGKEVLETLRIKAQMIIFSPVRETLKLKEFSAKPKILEGSWGEPFQEVVQAFCQQSSTKRSRGERL